MSWRIDRGTTTLVPLKKIPSISESSDATARKRPSTGRCVRKQAITSWSSGSVDVALANMADVQSLTRLRCRLTACRSASVDRCCGEESGGHVLDRTSGIDKIFVSHILQGIIIYHEAQKKNR